jgi:hypothetical protein
MTRSRTVSALLLFFAAVSASALDIAGERPVAAPARRAASGFATPLVPLATNGTAFFTAWIETRDGENAVYGTRVASSGRVLDPAGLRLAATDVSFGKTAVLWNGRDYIVFAPETTGIVIAQVRGGDRLVPLDVHITEPGVFLIDSAVWNGSHYALIVRGKNAAGMVIAKLLVVSPDFAVERSLTLNDDTTSSATASLVTDGNGFLLLYENYNATSDTVFVQRLDASGAPAGERRIVPTGAPGTRMFGSYWPAAAPNGNGGYTIVWMNGPIYGITMAADGTFGSQFTISNEEGTFPSIAWNGREHLVTWTHVAAGADGLFRLDAARISPSGAIAQAGTLGSTNLGWAQATLAGIPTGFLGVWFGNVVGDAEHDSLASRFYSQQQPLLAAGSSTMLAAWGEGGGIYATRLQPDGTPLDGAGIRLGLPQATESVAPLAVASTGKVYLVAWRRADGQVAVSRIREDGTLLDPNGGTALTSPGTSLVAASDGVDFLLVWSNGGTLTSLRVPAEGSIPQAPAPPFTTRFAETPLALQWNGSTYSLLWQQALEGEPIYQQRMSPLSRDGQLLGTAIIGVNLAVHGMELAGDELLVAYTSERTTYTQRFSRAGDPSSERAPVLSHTAAPILTPTRDGFALLYKNGDAVEAMLLDPAGLPRAFSTTVLRKKDVRPSDAIFAHGTTRVAYTAPQRIDAATEPLVRAFTGELRLEGSPATAGRRRAIAP